MLQFYGPRLRKRVGHCRNALSEDARIADPQCLRDRSFCRLIRFDKRGTGLSDRVKIPTLEQRMDDVRAVMDATGSEKAALFGLSDGGPMSILFAATLRGERSAWSSTARMRAACAGRAIRTE